MVWIPASPAFERATCRRSSLPKFEGVWSSFGLPRIPAVRIARRKRDSLRFQVHLEGFFVVRCPSVIAVLKTAPAHSQGVTRDLLVPMHTGARLAAVATD